jgi:hypothetical protein
VSDELRATSDQQFGEMEVPMKGFKELKVWRKAHSMTVAVYAVDARIPA